MQVGAIRSVRWRKWLLGCVTILIIAVVLFIIYRRPSRPDDRALDRVPLLGPYPVTIIPGVHLLGGLQPAAVYVVETTKELVLIDSGLQPDARILKAEMAKLGLDWKRVGAILLTHVHVDHSGGAEHLRAATGAKVYAGQGDAQVLREGGPREAHVGVFPMPNVVIRPTQVDVELQGGDLLVIGDVRFQALATPGHTPGGVCYLMERDQLRVLFSGDVIMSLVGDESSAAKWARPLGTYAAYMAPRHRGSAKDFLSSLRLLRTLPVPDLILPGHPRMDPIPQSPVLSQQRWEALLDAGIQEMEQLAVRYETHGRNFLDGNPRMLLPDLLYFGEFKGEAIYGLVASSKLYVVSGAVLPGLTQFLNSGCQTLGVKAATLTAILLTSSGPEATAGIKEIVKTGGVVIVAAAEAVPRIKETCPPGAAVIAAEDLPTQRWFDVKPLLLPGRDRGSVAYHVEWGKKSVLFTGRIPIPVSPTASKELLSDLANLKANFIDYRASLAQLGKLQPDLWLPAQPRDGQNANLFDTDWREIIASNRALLR